MSEQLLACLPVEAWSVPIDKHRADQYTKNIVYMHKSKGVRTRELFIPHIRENKKKEKVSPLQSGSGPLQNDGFPRMHLIATSPMSS